MTPPSNRPDEPRRTADKMERLCFSIELKDGGEEVYDTLHQNMSQELRRALAECGYENYTIFRNGTTVIGYAECSPDVQTVLQRQSETLGDELRPLKSVIAKPLTLAKPVWRLDDYG